MGQFFLAENESHIYLNMCAKFGCCPTVVSKGGGGVQTDIPTDKGNLQLYIIDTSLLQVLCTLRCYATGTFRRVIGGTMNVGAMSVSRTVNAVSVISAVNSNMDIIYFQRNSRVMFHEKDNFVMPTM